MHSERVLISVMGTSAPEFVPTLMAELARHPLLVEDLSHTATHKMATLCMLVALPCGEGGQVIRRQILACARGFGLTVHFDAVEPESRYEAQPRWVVTLLAGRLEAGHLARVTGALAEGGLGVVTMRRLSAGGQGETLFPSVLELVVSGRRVDEGAMRTQLLKLAQSAAIDIAFQLDNSYRCNRRMVAFDMDSTLIAAEVIDELARYQGVGDRVAAITERAMRGELDFTESLHERVALLRGVSEATLKSVAAALPLMDGAGRLLTQLRRHGYRTAILSGGFRYFAEQIAAQLGIDVVHANDLEIADGVLTGRVFGPVIDGARKAELLRELAGAEGFSLEQVVAVGDGANDLPMLALAGLGIAFRAKPLVRETAAQSLGVSGLDGILYLLGFADEELVGE